MARVRFRQLPPLEDAKETHRIGPNYVWGVFLGWELAPGRTGKDPDCRGPSQAPGGGRVDGQQS